MHKLTIRKRNNITKETVLYHKFYIPASTMCISYQRPRPDEYSVICNSKDGSESYYISYDMLHMEKLMQIESNRLGNVWYYDES